MAVTRISDVIVPEIFAPYVQLQTTQKSALIRSGAVVIDPTLSEMVSGISGGMTFTMPKWNDLADDDDNVSSDTGSDSTPSAVTTASEIAVRLDRNKSWGAADLVGALAGSDPMGAIVDRASSYWERKLQLIFLATVNGLFADNAAAPTGTDTHTINDMTHDISGSAFSDGVTTFSAEAFIDATQTMGDQASALNLIMVHSVVMAKMLKNNLIDFIPESQSSPRIPTFHGREVIEDDGLTALSSGVYQSLLFARGAIRLGIGTAKVPVETHRNPTANNGGGEEILTTRMSWGISPRAYAFIGSTGPGGPSNAATANNLAHADSWSRRLAERKMCGIARLITREM